MHAHKTISLGMLQKNSLENNDCLYVVATSQKRVGKPPVDNISSTSNDFQTNCQSVVLMLLKNIETTLGLLV